MASYPYRTFCPELARDLRRPIAPAEIHFKVQKQLGPDAARIVCYIDARVVIARLNLLVPGRWRATHTALAPDMRPPAGAARPRSRGADDQEEPEEVLLHYVCRLEVAGVRFEDVGEGSDPKACFSDSLKRAAVRAGIAESLRAFRIPPMRAGEGETRLRRNAKKRLYLDEANERALGRLYERWLERVGIAAFGEPLPHGPERPDAEGDADPGDVEQGAGSGADTDAGGEQQDGAAGVPDARSGMRVVRIPEADGTAGEPVGVGPGASDAPAQAGQPPAQASIASVAAAAAALSGVASGELVARLAALLAERPDVDEAPATPPSGERLSELAAVLAAGGEAGWSAQRLEEVIGRALASPRPPAERREAFLAHLEAARAAAVGARGRAA